MRPPTLPRSAATLVGSGLQRCGPLEIARQVAKAGLPVLVLAGAAMPAVAAEDNNVTWQPAQRLLLGQHEVELVVGDAAVQRIDALFTRYDLHYLQMHAARERRFDRLARRLFARTAAGEQARCSQQILLEAKWLLNYTAWWSRIDARLDDLEASFALADQHFATEPSPKDGFYDRCANEMFIRIEDTLVNYFDLASRGLLPDVERKPLQFARQSDGLSAYFEDHLISDIPGTGEDFRSRLGGFMSIVAAADRRDRVMELVRSTVRGPDLTPEEQAGIRARFNQIVDWWQDPQTGFWGAWYRDGQRIFKTTDLSITYHLVHARRGQVRHWRALIQTIFAIRDQTYPYGWLSDGHWTNHNNYDLARLFRYGWPHMSLPQRHETARTLREMLQWSFAATVQPDYQGFLPNPELASSLGAEFYFGVSFLVAAGFFESEPWFGPIVPPAPPRDVCRGMISHGRTLDGPLVAGARNKLETACKPFLPSNG